MMIKKSDHSSRRMFPGFLSALGVVAACALVSAGGTPAYASPAPTEYDVIFVVDGSAAVTQDGFIQEVTWAAAEMTYGMNLGTTDRAGIIAFSTATLSAYNLTETQSPTLLANTVRNLHFDDRTSYTKDAISAAINELTTNGRSGAQKEIVLLTTGYPNPPLMQNPCSLAATLDAEGIHVNIVLAGPTATAKTVECLVTNPSTDIAPVASAPLLPL